MSNHSSPVRFGICRFRLPRRSIARPMIRRYRFGKKCLVANLQNRADGTPESQDSLSKKKQKIISIIPYDNEISVARMTDADYFEISRMPVVNRNGFCCYITSWHERLPVRPFRITRQSGLVIIDVDGVPVALKMEIIKIQIQSHDIQKKKKLVRTNYRL